MGGSSTGTATLGLTAGTGVPAPTRVQKRGVLVVGGSSGMKIFLFSVNVSDEGLKVLLIVVAAVLVGGAGRGVAAGSVLASAQEVNIVKEGAAGFVEIGFVVVVLVAVLKISANSVRYLIY